MSPSDKFCAVTFFLSFLLGFNGRFGSASLKRLSPKILIIIKQTFSHFCIESSILVFPWHTWKLCTNRTRKYMLLLVPHKTLWNVKMFSLFSTTQSSSVLYFRNHNLNVQRRGFFFFFSKLGKIQIRQLHSFNTDLNYSATNKVSSRWRKSLYGIGKKSNYTAMSNKQQAIERKQNEYATTYPGPSDLITQGKAEP